MCVHERIYGMAAATELGLVLLDATVRVAGLPLGGGHVQQIGVVFGTAFILSEIVNRFGSGH